MRSDRLRGPGFLLVAIAMGWATWSLRGHGKHSAKTVPAAATGEMTVPVEIVVAGQAPQRREIRVSP